MNFKFKSSKVGTLTVTTMDFSVLVYNLLGPSGLTRNASVSFNLSLTSISILTCSTRMIGTQAAAPGFCKIAVPGPAQAGGPGRVAASDRGGQVEDF